MKAKKGKIIFFDIDGTLIGMDGVISQALKEGLAKAKENGHTICIATGRSPDFIVARLQKLDFDGYVLANGVYGEYKGKVVMHETIADEDVKAFVEYTKGLQGLATTVESNNGTFITADGIEVAYDALREASGGRISREEFLQYFTVVEDLSEIKEINKMMYFGGERYAKDLIARFSDRLELLPDSITQNGDWKSAEIMKKGINKAVGIEKIIQHAGYTRDDVIAFGDGYNDIEMIKFAGIGVAMGNAVEVLKEAANIVADTQANDGVVKMLRELKII